MYTSFTYLQNNLQNHLLSVMLINELSDQNCDGFLASSLQGATPTTISNICNEYSIVLPVKNLWKTALIFAKRSMEKNGKISYHLEQLTYNYSHIVIRMLQMGLDHSMIKCESPSTISIFVIKLLILTVLTMSWL